MSMRDTAGPVSYTHLDVYKRQGNIPPKDSNKQKILDIYKASANVKYRDSVGIEPIRKYLDMIDGCLLYTSRCV